MPGETGGFKQMVSAIILASGPCSAELEEVYGKTRKSLIEVGGRTMLQRVWEAVRQSPSVGRIVVVGPKEALQAAPVEAESVLSDSAVYSENLACGLKALREERVLILAGDVPLLRAENLEAFVTAALRFPDAVCFPVISLEGMEAVLPGVRKTWYELREGMFTKGNAVVGPRDLFLRRLSRIDALFQTRKRKQWVNLLSQSFAGKMAPRAASLADVEAGLGLYLGAKLHAVPCAPELAADVDEVGDVDFVRTVLAQRVEREEALC
jgi:CTP:molybdopterin cytidylyltransferase MocA